jgi:hypothetical protein
MGRIEIEGFSDMEIARIFIADSIGKAEKVEAILTENDIDYALSLEPYVGVEYIMAFVTERNGVAFYVLSGQASHAMHLLASKGLSSGLTVEEPI